MKKLMIAAAIVCTAAFAQAATCTWSSGTVKNAKDAEGGWGNTTLTKMLVTMTVHLIDEKTYDKLAGSSQSDLYAAYKDSTTGKILNGSNANGVDASGNPKYKGSFSITEDPATAGIEYAVVIAQYSDTTLGKDFYMATLAESVYASATETGNALNIISGKADWQPVQSIPEPTSALLLLFGVAGLALRRRRA